MLTIAVCLKQVPDPLAVEIDPLTGAINQARLVYITNPPDAGALELALRWRETTPDAWVRVVTYGPERADQILREALAVGADSVTRISHSPKRTAEALASVLRPLNPDIVLCGSRSADMATGLVPGLLAEYLGLAQATGVTQANFQSDANQIKVERKLERGRRQRLLINLPALLAVEAGIAKLRYASFPGHLAAQQATIPVVEATFSNKPETALRRVGISAPRPRPRQIFIPDPNLSAAARIEAILSGGAAIKQKKAGPVEGSAQEQAARIADFLEQNGFLE